MMNKTRSVYPSGLIVKSVVQPCADFYSFL